MRLHELLEARVEPDQDFLAQLEEIVDESIAEYQEFLEENNDVDPNEWISAVADWDEKEGKTITIYLHAKNLEKVYGPKSFKNILMRMLGHETIHWNQYDKMGAKVLNNYKSGYQKGVIKKASGGDERDLMRSYLRDPHELMAYAHDLAGEMKETDNPEEALRNPEKYKAELPVYERFREIFPPNAKQLRQLLKYTADYFKV